LAVGALPGLGQGSTLPVTLAAAEATLVLPPYAAVAYAAV